MKKVELLIGDYEYSQIQEIFENENEFDPKTDKDVVLIKTLRSVISPKNLVEEDVGAPETYSETVVSA